MLESLVHLGLKVLHLSLCQLINKRIIDATAKRLGLKDSQVLINIDRYANTTSATIPICLAEASENNMINKGENLIISTFGAGFSWGAMYLKWGSDNNE